MAIKLDKDMNTPAVTDFDDYPGQPIKGLKTSGIKWSQKGNSLTIKIPQSRVIKFFAFSKNGITESKKGSKYFIRFNGSEEDVNKNSLYSAVENITLFCVDVWRALKDEITKRLMGATYTEELLKDVRTSILSGANEVSFDEENQQISYTVFLHKTYTKSYSYDAKNKGRSSTSVVKLTGKSGNSNFQCSINLKTIVVEYDPISNLFMIKVFINANDLTWINVGQKSDSSEQEEEENHKKLVEAQAIKELDKFIDTNIKLGKRKNVDTGEGATASNVSKKQNVNKE